jgi:hypothetical protein
VPHDAGRQTLIRMSYPWWREKDSNLRRQRQQIYSLPRLTTSVSLHISNHWCRREDLNPQPTDYKSVALPVELHRQTELKWWFGTESNRRHEDFQSSALPTELPNRAALGFQVLASFFRFQERRSTSIFWLKYDCSDEYHINMFALSKSTLDEK